ncbi:MAG: PAS domain S-box protein [Bacteroidales bacterium]|nr:PAS domain S-box protein [Bacteroidales bacterium]
MTAIKYLLILFFTALLLPGYGQAKTYVVGGDFNYPPFTYIDKTGNARGFDIDVLNAISAETGIKFKYKLSQWDSAFNDLETGNTDILAGVIFSNERGRLLDFSHPVQTEYYSIFIRKKLHFKDISDLYNYKLMVLKGDISIERFLIPNGLFHNYIEAKSLPEAIAGIESGKADYVIAPYSLGMDEIMKHKYKNIEIKGPPLIPSIYCFAVKKGNSNLLGVLNKGISELRNNGELAKIQAKWAIYERDNYKYRRISRLILISFLIALLVLALVFIWVVLLRKQIKKKTKSINLKNEALHEREERLQLIINLANEGVVIAQDLNLALVNPKTCEIAGRSEDELKNTPFLDIIHPEDRELTKHNYEKRLKGEAPESKYEIRILNSNNTIRWVEVYGRKIDWQGKPATLNFLNDITEAKAFARTLEESEAKFRYIAENSSDVIWHVDTNLICDYISLADERMRGYTQEEVLGGHLFDILKPGTFDHLIANLQKRFADEKAGIKTTIAPIYELEEKCKDGSWVWVEATATPHHDENGNFLGLNGVTRDISKRKKAEAEIELKTKQLIAANTDKDRFVSILAHDLRSPFQSLLGFLALLNDNIEEYTTEQIAEIIKKLYESANNTYNFLEDLLEWTRSQKTPFQPREIPFKDIWSDIINAIEGSANSKGISISNNIPLDLVLYADSNMLKTVLRNLISNAIKFTHKGGSIKLFSVEIEEGINISVADTGVGMTEDVSSKLFDITNKYTTKGTLNETGSGFGLVLCKEFLEKHKGKIWVESEVDKGSIFTFLLPFQIKTH